MSSRSCHTALQELVSVKNTVSGSRALGELVDQVKRSVIEVESMQGRIDNRHVEGASASAGIFKLI